MPVALSTEAAVPPPRGLTRSGNVPSSRSAALDRIASGLIASRAGGVGGGPGVRRRPRPVSSAAFVAPAPPLPSRTGSATTAAPNASNQPATNTTAATTTTATTTTMTPPKSITAKKEMRRTAVLCLGLVDRLRDERVGSAVAPLATKEDEDVGDLMVDFPSETERMALRRERSLGSSLDLSGFADCTSDAMDEQDEDEHIELSAEDELERGVSSSSSSSAASSRRSSLSSSTSSFSAAAAQKPILRRHRKYSQSVPAPPSYGFSDVSTHPSNCGGGGAAAAHRAARRRSSITSAFARRSSITSSSLASSCGRSRRTSTCSTLTASTLSADSNRSLLSSFFDDSLNQSASGSTRMRIRIVDRDSEEGWRSNKSVRFAEDEEEDEEEEDMASCGNSWHSGGRGSLELNSRGGRTEGLTLDSGARSA